MAYTQAEIDAAELKMKNAESAKNSAYTSMQSWCTLISGYKFKEVGANTCVDKNRVYPSCGEEFEGDCCFSTSYSSQTCESNKTTYNQRVTDYDNAVDAYESAKDYYETIKGDKKQGEVDTGVAKLEQEAKAIRTRYIIFGVIVLALIGVAVFFIFKSKK